MATLPCVPHVGEDVSTRGSRSPTDLRFSAAVQSPSSRQVAAVCLCVLLDAHNLVPAHTISPQRVSLLHCGLHCSTLPPMVSVGTAASISFYDREQKREHNEASVEASLISW